MNKYLIFLFVWLQSTLQGGDDVIQKYLYLLNNKTVFEHTNIGVAVHDVQSGKLLSGYNSNKTLIPASSLKVLTSLVLLEELGSDFVYKTTLAYDGKIIADGTLEGNLYIIGSGDPSLGSDRFKEKPGFFDLLSFIAKKISDASITCIDGEIIADESVYDAFPIAPSWQWNDLGNYYAGGTWGINIAENEYKVYFDSNKPINTPARLLYTDPVVPGLELNNEVIVDSAGSGDNAYIFGGPYTYHKRIVGTIPRDNSPFRIKGSLPDPPKFLVQYLEKKMNEMGIVTHGYSVQMKEKPNNKQRTGIDTLTSVRLLSLVKEANYKSINLYCESFLKTLGQYKLGESSGSGGINYIRKYLKNARLDDGSLFMQDGSGLSSRNLISPELLSKFLAHFANKNSIDIVKEVLPLSGSEGTVSGMLDGYASKGKVWMKSGSMDQVQSFTGICKSKSGRWLSFSIILNGFGEKHRVIKPDIEKLIDLIYRNY